MKESLLKIIDEYLQMFPGEKGRQKQLKDFLSSHEEEQFIDWNNFDGHIVASGFVYSIKEKKFLVLYHKDLKMYLYPGGHIDKSDSSILAAAEREVKEETGLHSLNLFQISENKMVPIDINIHYTKYNERLNLPSHAHFDFRYLFTINEITDVHIDQEESSDYKWITMSELKNDSNYGTIAEKIKMFLNK